jgi:3-hydroxybutyryl-CoA dehydrogenase
VPIRTVGVIGTGRAGRGITEVLATHGFEVILVSRGGAGLDSARLALDQALQHQLDRWAITEAEKKVALSRIRYTTDLQQMAAADLLLEAIVEDIGPKEELFRTLDQVCRPDVILASNTSTLSITQLGAATGRPDRAIGCHFLSPVTRSRVVEVVRGLKTSEETVARTVAFVADLGRTPVDVYESTGYITTRLIVPLINEAADTLLEGVATAEAIDTAMRLGFEWQRGPLETADRIGLDVLLVVMERLWREYGDLRYRPAPLIRKLVRAGHVGVESGVGFFKYDRDGNRVKESLR